MATMLKDKQLITFQKLIANHRFLDRSHAGTGKTPSQCCLTGYLMRIQPQQIIQLIQNGVTKTSTPTSSNYKGSKAEDFLKPTSARIVTNGQFNCRVIWIQPSSLMNKNRKEILKWNPDLGQDQVQLIKGTANQKQKIALDPNVLVWIMTAEAYAKYSGLMHKQFADIVQIICDEPHLYYRGWLSKRTQSFVQSTPDRVRISFMTATPTPRGKLQSAYIYCHMIQPDYYHSFDFFMATHAIRDEYTSVSEWINHEVLQKFLLHYSICWTSKEMYGDVDEVILRELLPLDSNIEKVYHEFEQAGIAEIKDIVLEAKTGGTNSLRLRQMLAHPHRINIPSEWDIKGKPTGYAELCLLAGNTPKIERILELAEEGEPIIVFGTFIQEIEAIATALSKKGLKVGIIHGEIPRGQRDRLDEAFQAGDIDVMVCSAATAGVGYNWGHVNTVIFHSLNYGDDEFLQAVARTKRGVREHLLQIIILEYENTVDQYVMWAVHHNSKSSHSANPTNPVIHFPKVEMDAMSMDLQNLLSEFMDYKEVGEKMII